MANVATKSKAAQAMEANITLASTLMGGTSSMRAAGAAYLPKWPNESAESHKERLAVATLYPAYSRTVKTLTGKPFSKPITYGDNVPPAIEEMCKQDVDLQGRNLQSFAADVLQEALALGMSGVLVDYPPVVPGTVRTKEQETSLGLRPYMVQIHPQQILGWRATQKDGLWRFTQLRIMEYVTEDVDAFEEREIEQVKVFSVGAWETYRKVETGPQAGDWALHKSGVTTLKHIPFVPVYGERVGFMRAIPPMIEMAYLNVEHWQDSSDQAKSVHFGRIRLAVIIGSEQAKESPITIGSDSFVHLPLGSDIKVVQGSAEAINIGRKELEALEERMRQAGAELLVLSPGNITATQVGTENAVGMCALQRIVQSTQDALDLALQYMAELSGESEGGNITIFNDFGAFNLTEASASILLTAAQNGKISDETLFEEMQRRSIVSSDREWDEEKARLDDQGPAPGEMGNNPAGGIGAP